MTDGLNMILILTCLDVVVSAVSPNEQLLWADDEKTNDLQTDLQTRRFKFVNSRSIQI